MYMYMYLHSGSPGTGGRSITSFLVGGACMAWDFPHRILSRRPVSTKSITNAQTTHTENAHVAIGTH